MRAACDPPFKKLSYCEPLGCRTYLCMVIFGKGSFLHGILSFFIFISFGQKPCMGRTAFVVSVDKYTGCGTIGVHT